MNNLINLDANVEEIIISERQLFDLHKKYGTDGIRILERQVMEKGLLMESLVHDRTIRIRRVSKPDHQPQPSDGLVTV